MVYKATKKTSKFLNLSKNDIEKDFKQLADQWRKEVSHLSSDDDRIMNQYYQRIIGLGPDVIPILLRELQKRLDHWFWALYILTGENPVKPEDAGYIKKMAQAWLEWGKQKGYL